MDDALTPRPRRYTRRNRQADRPLSRRGRFSPYGLPLIEAHLIDIGTSLGAPLTPGFSIALSTPEMTGPGA